MVEQLNIDCSLRDAGLKTWVKAIQSLCLVGGTDVHFKFTEEALSVITHDAAVSAYATLSFSSNFFTSYACGAKDEDKVQCKVPTKCLLKAFRSTKFMTKSMEECRIQYTKDADRLDVTMITRFGASLNYSLRLISDSEVLEIDCDPQSLTSFVSCDAKIILGSLSNFHSGKGLGDLTLKVAGTVMSLRNSLTDLVKKEGKVYTELGLNTVDFLDYSIEKDCILTFPLREFKTFASFAETMKTPITIRFENETDPVMVMIRNAEGSYHGSLMLANRGGRVPVQQAEDTSLPNADGPVNDVSSRLATTDLNTSRNIINNNTIVSSMNKHPTLTGPHNISSANPRVRLGKRPAPLLFPNVGNARKIRRVKNTTEVDVIVLSDSSDDET